MYLLQEHKHMHIFTWRHVSQYLCFYCTCICQCVIVCVCMRPPPQTSPSLSSCECRASQLVLAIVTSPPLLSGITIIYFIYQTACHACSLPPPVSDALFMPLNANETLAPNVIEQHDASSKCVQQMSLISRDLI